MTAPSLERHQLRATTEESDLVASVLLWFFPVAGFAAALLGLG